MDSHGDIHETVFDLPLRGIEHHTMLTGNFWSDQELFEVGVGVDAQMRVLDTDSTPVYANLYAVGSILAGATRWSEKSGEGIALGSAMAATDAIIKES